MGAIAFIWSLWLCRNDKVFNDKNSSILQVIYRAIGTLRLWSALQRPQDRDLYTEVETSIRRSVHDWKLRRGILFPNMAVRIVYGSVLLVRQLYNCSL
jgi:hypothetical protein